MLSYLGIELFQNMGYTHVYGPDIERDFKSPLYDDILEDCIRKVNPGAPNAAIMEALEKIRNFEIADLVDKNYIFTEYLQNGIECRYRENGEERTALIKLADFKNPDNNSFIIANQWSFEENSVKRPDLLIFLNGIPVVLMELKSPSREETDASEAYKQIRNYMQEIPSKMQKIQPMIMSIPTSTITCTMTAASTPIPTIAPVPAVIAPAAASTPPWKSWWR